MKNIKMKPEVKKTIKKINKSVKAIDKERIKMNDYDIQSQESQSDYGNKQIKKVNNEFGTLINKTIKKENDRMYNRTINSINTTKSMIKKINKKIINHTNKIKKVKKTSSSIIKTIRNIFKTTFRLVKGIFKGTKLLISLLLAFGWVSIIIIILICFIGLLYSSSFGIFFSNEEGNKTISSVIKNVNNEVYSKIESIKNSNEYDDVIIESTYSNWAEIIAVYSVKYNENGKYNITIIDDNNENNLKNVFWDFNNIESDIIEDEENKKYLKINVVSKSKEKVMSEYNFSSNDINDVNFLLSKENNDMWNNLIYGSFEGNTQIIELAKQQIGNVGGEIYWKWYGFNSRVEWCAVFISWLANETGMLNDKIPKFAVVNNGISWFKSRGEWKNRSYVPRVGDIIFFDWENDGKPNHVGIVEKVEGNYIYTIEGNSTNDTCRNKKYNINSNVIYGFGLPNY